MHGPSNHLSSPQEENSHHSTSSSHPAFHGFGGLHDDGDKHIYDQLDVFAPFPQGMHAPLVLGLHNVTPR